MERDNLYCAHIRDAISKIETYVHGVAFEAFDKNFLLQDGAVREFEVIGEAARHLSEAFKARHTDIPWRQVIDMRNKLVHEYFNVDTELVWATIERDLPMLKNAVKDPS